ncbi:hypothetical protein PYJP_16040 [Pyrofollis japonicus]|uniref:S16 family serine protease n=1 Tax=Pyrofollis japonicus TaxID=3060460 RepID=UPI00295C3583|nr:S16 family serine protease [Pyrofollis japonicus]BEP18252.1 hypothetical protein PYJP_16040 [Pyrofollis japonicus]
MDRRYAAALAIFLLFVALVSSIAQAYSVRLGLLAVSGSRGEVIPAFVEISYDGQGGLTIEPKQYVHESVFYSFKVGYILASLLSHIPPGSVSVHVRIQTDTRVEGPSASGMMAAITFLGIRGLYPKNDTTMTGMISLTGFILPVAGVPQKVKAAKDAGYKTVVLPCSEALEGVKGIRIDTACSLEEAAEALSGARLIDEEMFGLASAAKALNTTLSTIRDSVSVFDNYTRFFIETANKLLDDYQGPRKNTYKALIELAETALGRGDSYSAASIAFYTVVNLATEMEREKGFNYIENVTSLSLEQAIKKAESVLNMAEKEVGNSSVCDLWRIEALAAAASRLYLAKNAANTGADKVLALFRAVSAESWALFSEHINGPKTTCDSLRNAIRDYVDYADLSYKYIQSSIEYLTQNLYMPDNRTIGAWLKDAEDALDKGDYVLALGLAEEVIASFENIFIDYADIPLNHVVSHTFYILENTVFGLSSSIETILYLDYAIHYAGEVGEIVNIPNFASTLGSEASVWSLFGLFFWNTHQEQASIVPVEHTAPGAVTPGAPIPLFIEASILAVLTYAVALLARRSFLEEV